MELKELAARLDDLYRQCEKKSVVTHTGFLTPAEQVHASGLCRAQRYEGFYLFGGNEQAERKLAFFLPYYLSPDQLDGGEYIQAIRAEARFSSLSHRDFLGALLGLGVERDCLGDIYVSGERAYFYVTPQVSPFVLLNLDKVGRGGVKLARVPLEQVEAPQRAFRPVEFTVKSMRLDAVAAGAFGLSRASAVREIAGGGLALNYQECLRPDAEIKEGDVLSLRGKGKGTVTSCDGLSRKGRIFVRVDLWK